MITLIRLLPSLPRPRDIQGNCQSYYEKEWFVLKILQLFGTSQTCLQANWLWLSTRIQVSRRFDVQSFSAPRQINASQVITGCHAKQLCIEVNGNGLCNYILHLETWEPRDATIVHTKAYLQDLLWWSLYKAEPFLLGWGSWLRKKALDEAIRHIRYEVNEISPCCFSACRYHDTVLISFESLDLEQGITFIIVPLLHLQSGRPIHKSKIMLKKVLKNGHVLPALPVLGHSLIHVIPVWSEHPRTLLWQGPLATRGAWPLWNLLCLTSWQSFASRACIFLLACSQYFLAYQSIYFEPCLTLAKSCRMKTRDTLILALSTRLSTCCAAILRIHILRHSKCKPTSQVEISDSTIRQGEAYTELCSCCEG